MKTTLTQIKAACRVATAVLIAGALLFGFGGFGGMVTIIAMAAVKDAQWYLSLSQVFVWLLMAGVLGYLAWIFDAINRSGTPFVPRISRHMKQASLLLLASIALPWWGGQLARNLSMGTIGFTLVNESVAIGVALFACLFCFAVIFEYGCRLQQESDETL